MPSLTYKVIDTFLITNRGLVILGDATCDAIHVGTECEISIRTPSGETMNRKGFKEWLLKKTPEPLETEAYLVIGASKAEIPIGSVATITQTRNENGA